MESDYIWRDFGENIALIGLTAGFNNTVANIDKQRRQTELSFKWIKQRLIIKSFFGTSFNGVKTQIWGGAISIYLMIAIMKKRLNMPGSLHTILKILEINIFEKKPRGVVG